MIYQKLSKRQKLAMLWWQQPRFHDRDALICDGSIRSGKTVCMTVGFILWSMVRFNGQKFALCGKTIESLRRNVILNLRDWIPSELSIVERRSENKLIISDGTGRENTYFLFGGRDESSYTLIQGITLAGVLLDEVALQPQSFVEQALARCSIEGSKFWFNCNPEGPEHWFHKNWVEGNKPKEKNALHLHFTMDDNPALPAKIRQRYEGMYSGVFYQRYILGLWVVAEGLIYTMFNKDFHVVPAIPRPYDRYYISVDYGTANPCSMGLWGRADGNYVGRKSNIYTDGKGITRFSPLSDWSHEHILAFIHYHQLPIPPIYGWVNGYLCGTHPWPARQWTGSEENGWREVYNIDKSIVITAADYLPGARTYLEVVEE